MSRASSNLPLFLFLIGILSYGATFAWYLLSSFDIINLVRDVNIDDAFYYFQIARNLADGKFSTFDGGITRTNGYHPVWMLLITPFYWMFGPENALFAIKAFEIILIAGGVVLIALAVRLAGLPWILLFGVLPALYNHPYLTVGSEAACALFFLGMLFLAAILFSRSPDRYAWPLTLIVFILPWVRLEYIVVSLAVAGSLLILSRSGSRTTEQRPPSSTAKSFAPLLGAGAGISTYFIYNGLVFGGIVPVSGATKLFLSRNAWEQGGGYDFLENLSAVMTLIGRHVGFEEWRLPLLVLEVCVYVVLVWGLSRRSPGREDRLLLVFLVCVLSLGLEHLSKIMFSALNTHPYLVAYSAWYYVPAYLMAALIVPTRCYMIIYIIRRFSVFQSFGTTVSSNCIIVAGLIWISITSNFMGHWTFVDQKRDLLTIDGPWDYPMSAYTGTLVLNRILPENSIVGSWDSGIVGYMSRFPVVNLDGLANSYDYHRAYVNNSAGSMYDSYGIDWFANIRSLREGQDSYSRTYNYPVFEGKVFGSYGGDGIERAFWIMRRKPLPAPSDGTTASGFKLWERIQPDAGLQFDDVKIVVDGRLVHVFVKDCVPDRLQSDFLVLRGSENNSSGYFPHNLGNMRRNRTGLCIDAFLLPIGMTPLIRITRIGPKYHDGSIRILGAFEDGFDDWSLDGDAVTNHRDHEGEYEQQPISGNIGPGFLTSFHPDRGDQVSGGARSPEFTAREGSFVVFWIAGGNGDGVGVRLLADGEEVRTWRGRNSETFVRILHPLAEVAGKTLQLELFDQESGGWGHVMLDHVMVIHPKAAR